MNNNISAFMEYLNFEKGLSDNSQEAYQRDLIKFNHFLKNKYGYLPSPQQVNKQDVMDFLS